MADNFLYIPYINPIKFIDSAYAPAAPYNSKHFDDYLFAQRLYEWQTPADFKQVWQKTDIIRLQFESTFDPIVVDILDSDGNAAITQIALIGLPNKFLANTYSFEVELSLATLATGCYKIQITAGSAGPTQKTYISGWQYVYDGVIDNTMLIEYYHNRYHEDVMFETGIEFQFRVHGKFGFMNPASSQERYKDQQYNPSILSSKNFRQWPVHFGDEFGLPDDIIDLLNRIWTCRSIFIDGKAFGAVDGKFELSDGGTDGVYPKRSVKLEVEEGINRRSKVFAQDTDTTKKLVTSIIVDAKVFGDLSNQGSSNAVPVINIE